MLLASAVVLAGAFAVGSAARPRESVTLPPPAARADYQLGGAYPPSAEVRIVARDRLEKPAAGTYGICYVNAFQSQPADTPWWRIHHRGLLLRDTAGREVGDPDWPGEVLLDTRTAASRRALLDVVGGWFDGCARSGFSAVEPDNLDSWTRSNGLLTWADNAAYARLLTARAHERAMAVAQKNAAELAPQGRSLGFDFAVAEECQAFGECDAYTAAYGARVIEVEYSDQGRDSFDRACLERRGRASIVYRDRDLTPPGEPGHARATC